VVLLGLVVLGRVLGFCALLSVSAIFTMQANVLAMATVVDVELAVWSGRRAVVREIGFSPTVV
jgi:hypothetical protein